MPPVLPYLTSPLAEAVEEGLDATRAWIAGPGAALRGAAAAMEQPGFNAASAVNGSVRIAKEVLTALLVSGVSFTDAMAGLADPPERFELHDLQWAAAPATLPFATIECRSWSQFEPNSISNPPLKGTIDGILRQGNLALIRLKVEPVPATPDFTVRFSVDVGRPLPEIAYFDLGRHTRRDP